MPFTPLIQVLPILSSTTHLMEWCNANDILAKLNACYVQSKQNENCSKYYFSEAPYILYPEKFISGNVQAGLQMLEIE